MTTMNFSPVRVAGDSNFLKGDAIYRVKLKEIKEETIKGKEKDGVLGQDYDVLTLVFAEVNDEGNIDENSKEFHDKIFPITEQSFKRSTRKIRRKNGEETEIENPSVYESVKCKFQLYLEALRPSLYAEIASGKKNLSTKGWDGFKKTMIDIFSITVRSSKNPICKLKLLKNNNFATLPIFTSISKDGECYINNRFIGNEEMLASKKQDVAFTSYELSKIKERQEAVNNATPSSQLLGSYSATNNPLESGNTVLEDIDINDIDI